MSRERQEEKVRERVDSQAEAIHRGFVGANDRGRFCGKRPSYLRVGRNVRENATFAPFINRSGRSRT